MRQNWEPGTDSYELRGRPVRSRNDSSMNGPSYPFKKRLLFCGAFSGLRSFFFSFQNAEIRADIKRIIRFSLMIHSSLSQVQNIENGFWSDFKVNMYGQSNIKKDFGEQKEQWSRSHLVWNKYLITQFQ